MEIFCASVKGTRSATCTEAERELLAGLGSGFALETFAVAFSVAPVAAFTLAVTEKLNCWLTARVSKVTPAVPPSLPGGEEQVGAHETKVVPDGSVISMCQKSAPPGPKLRPLREKVTN